MLLKTPTPTVTPSAPTPIAQWQWNMGPRRPYRPDPPIVDAVNSAVDETFGPGSTVVVTSGQEGGLPQHGSNRHRTGLAVDFQVRRPDGSLVSIDDPDALRFGQAAARHGVRGIGAGREYMGPNTFHMDAVPHENYTAGQGPAWGSWGNANEAALVASMSGSAPQSRGLLDQRPPSPSQGLLGGAGDTNVVGQRASDGLAPTPPRTFREGLKDAARSGALFDQLALAFNSLRHSPDPTIARTVSERQNMRRDSQQRNRTAEWLRTQGRDDLAAALESGAISGQDAYAAMRPAAPIKGVVIDGRLVNPVTGQLMADYSTPDQPAPYSQAGKLAADLRGGLITEDQYRDGLAGLSDSAPSAAEAAIARIMEVQNPTTGETFTRKEAIQISDLYTVSRNPQTGEAQLVNKATGRPVGGTTTLPTPAAPDPRPPEDFGNVAGALGVGGIAANTVNTIGDTVGLGLAFPEAERAESALRNLSTQTMLVMSGEWSGRPSNLTRERIEALTVKPNEFGTGQGSAIIKLRDMRDLVANALGSAEAVQGGQFTPTQKTQARQKAGDLALLLQQYDAIITNLEGGRPGRQGNTAGQTSGGIKWSIEP